MARPWWDDDELLTVLDSALHAALDVPADFIEVGMAAYAWHNIDAELAALTYDSARAASDAIALTRAEPATLRALTFVAPDLTLELEVADDALRGQLVPPQPGQVEVLAIDGTRLVAAVDEVGYFMIRPVPSGSFRLYCRTGTGINVLTSQVAL